MSSVLRTIEFLSVAIWLGSVVFLSFVVAPTAFGVLGNRDQAGAMVGLTLTRMHWLGVSAGSIFLLTHVIRLRSVAALWTSAALAVMLMMALTLVSQLGISRRMAWLRTEMGSVERTPAENPLRAEFNRLHRRSVGLELGVLVAGLAAVVLLVREK